MHRNPYKTTHVRIPEPLKIAVSDIVDDWLAACSLGALSYSEAVGLDDINRAYDELFTNPKFLAIARQNAKGEILEDS